MFCIYFSQGHTHTDRQWFFLSLSLYTNSENRPDKGCLRRMDKEVFILVNYFSLPPTTTSMCRFFQSPTRTNIYFVINPETTSSMQIVWLAKPSKLNYFRQLSLLMLLLRQSTLTFSSSFDVQTELCRENKHARTSAWESLRGSSSLGLLRQIIKFITFVFNCCEDNQFKGWLERLDCPVLNCRFHLKSIVKAKMHISRAFILSYRLCFLSFVLRFVGWSIIGLKPFINSRIRRTVWQMSRFLHSKTNSLKLWID